MNVTHLLADLRQRNITVRVKGDNLSVVAEKDVLSPAIKAALVNHKAAIVNYLRQLEQEKAPEVQVIDRGQHLPLSSGQQRLWFLAQLEPDSVAYVIPAAIRIEGLLQPALLSQALEQIVHRHEVLRTVFKSENGNPRQVIRPKMAVPFSFIDLRQKSAAEREAKLQACIRQKMDEPFDLSGGPLLRAALVRLAEQEHVLLLALHHIVADGWSMGILARELWAFYAAAQEGRTADLPALPVQYADYAVWQHRWNESPARNRQLAYWERQLAELEPVALPVDHPHNDNGSSRGATARFMIPNMLADRLKNLGLKEEATPFVVFLAAFNVLLSRYSGQSQIALGTPVANRERREIDGLIGFFVNTLVLFSEASASYSFRDFLRRVKNTALDALENQDLPFEQLVDHLQPARNLNQNPLFQVMFIFQNVPRSDLQMGDITLRPFNIDTQTVKFDLTLSLSPEQNHFEGWFRYNNELFEQATVDRMILHYEMLLHGIVEEPEQSLAELPLLTEAERRQLINDWNQTAAEYAPKFIHNLLEEQAAMNPDNPAVKYEGQQLTYHELNARANQLARWLRKMGVGPEARVGIYASRSLEMIVAIMGILKSGGAYVPLEPGYPAERLAYMARNAKLKLLLTQQRLKEQAAHYGIKVIYLDGEPDEEQLERQSTANLEPVSQPENLAYVIYTSGSTGQPKGVGVSHDNLLHSTLARWKSYDKPVKRFLLLSSFAFDSSVAGIFWTLGQGGTLYLPSGTGQHDLDILAHQIVQSRISHILCIPSLYETLVKDGPEGFADSLQAVIVAGESCPSQLVRRHEQKAPQAILYNEYGPTEASVWCTVYRHQAGQVRSPIPIGRPIANAQVYILDMHMQPAPVGVAGELFVGGNGVARGYLERPELTAEKFLPDPFSEKSGARFYRTGDSVRYLADGTIEYLGRIDGQVKIRGYRIELDEIEAALQQNAKVEQCVVTVHIDGTGDKRLVAYFVSSGSDCAQADELRNALKIRLPDYMVPAYFLPLEKMPLTPNGKIDYKALPKPEYQAGNEQIPPSTVEEEILCGIFADVLKLDRVGVTQSFFDVGGHSLLATQVISRIRAAFDVALPLRSLFESPTVAGMARVIDQVKTADGAEKMPPITRVPRDRAIPLSFAQQRLWFLDQLQPGLATYNLPLALRISGLIQIQLIEQAFTDLINRHEALRTIFYMADGEPAQGIAPVGYVTLPVTDLTWLPPDATEEEAMRLAVEEAEKPFELARGPLVRIHLLRLSEQEHVLVVTMHHIVSDGWSIGIMVRELSRLYEARRKGEESGLMELPIQYADYSVWQREWLRGKVLKQQLGYWKERLGGVAMLGLATDRRRPEVMSYEGGTVEFYLGPEHLEKLKRLSRQRGTTLYMTCLAAWKALLFRYSGQEDIAVGSPIAGRRWKETEGLIGFFVNTLVLRSGVRGEESFGELLRQIRELTLEAYAHQDVPFEKVVEELEPERDLSRTPLFQVMFMLQNTPKFELELGEIKLAPFQVESGTAKFDLALSLSEEEGKMRGWLNYRGDLYERATVERMVGHYCKVLRGITAGVEEKIGELALLEEEERQQLVKEWNGRVVRYARKGIAELFEEQAEARAEAMAVECEGEQLTYRELNHRANQLGWYLRKLGVRAEVRVGLCMERSLEMVVAILGIVKAGGAYVPLDPDYPTDRLEFMGEEAQTLVILAQEKSATAFSQSKTRLVKLNSKWELIRNESQRNLNLAIEPENLVYVIYTSGSTGRPKGAMNTHGGLKNRILWMQEQYPLVPDDRVLQKTPYSFDVSVWEFFWPLVTGAGLIVAQPGGHRDPQYLADLIEQKKITTLHFVPSMLSAFWDAGGDKNCGSVRRVICSGEALNSELVRNFAQRMDAELHNLYGPTEASIEVTHWACDPAQINHRVPIGKPIANTAIYILDAFGQPVPVLVAGELFIAGEGLARGYVNHPELTAERFVPDHLSGQAGERLYRTGDKARWSADGNLEYLGRMDDQVKIRGQRIELGEIETVLMQQHAVDQAAVVVREDERGDKLILACIVAHEEIKADELRRSLKQRLPDYMLPSAFVWLESMPLTSNGKIDRRTLAKLSPGQQRHERTCVAPRTSREETLAQIWAELLTVHSIGIHDDFFAIGGHSLLLFRLKTLIKKHFGCDLPLSSLFQSPTIAGIAKLLETPKGTSLSPILMPMQAQGSRVPFFCVHPIGGEVACYSALFRELGGDQPFYGLRSPDPGGPHVSTIEQMASLYIQEIRRVQTIGPYQLGGWSMGGLIALEMAHQLIGQGATVALLALFDTFPPLQSTGVPPDGNSSSVLELFAEHMSRSLKNSGGLRDQFLRLGPEEQFKLIQDALVREQVLPQESAESELNRLLEIFSRNATAMNSYQLRPIDQRIILFLADGREPPECVAERWKPWTAGVEWHAVPGDHYAVLQPPHVSTAASILTSYLESRHQVPQVTVHQVN